MYNKKALDKTLKKLSGTIHTKVSHAETHMSRVLWEVFGSTLEICDIELDLQESLFNWSIEYRNRRIYIQINFDDIVADPEEDVSLNIYGYNNVGKEVFSAKNYQLRNFKKTMQELFKILNS